MGLGLGDGAVLQFSLPIFVHGLVIEEVELAAFHLESLGVALGGETLAGRVRTVPAELRGPALGRLVEEGLVRGAAEAPLAPLPAAADGGVAGLRLPRM